jgi:hypothetical protein
MEDSRCKCSGSAMGMLVTISRTNDECRSWGHHRRDRLTHVGHSVNNALRPQICGEGDEVIVSGHCVCTCTSSAEEVHTHALRTVRRGCIYCTDSLSTQYFFLIHDSKPRCWKHAAGTFRSIPHVRPLRTESGWRMQLMDGVHGEECHCDVDSHETMVKGGGGGGPGSVCWHLNWSR